MLLLAAPACHAQDSIDAALVFQWLPVPWLTPLIIVVALLAGAAAFRWYGPAPGGRRSGLLARLCRATAIAVVVLAAAGPALITTTEHRRPGAVALAIDASASMATVDVAVPGAKPQARVVVAAEVAKRLRERTPTDQAAITVHGLCRNDLAAIEPSAVLAANGATSPIADDLDRLVRGRKPDALVVVSDGRITAGATFDQLAEAWRIRELPTFLLALGGEAVVPDLTIDEVQVNRDAALGEVEPIQVTVSARGLTGAVVVEARIDGGPPIGDALALPPGDLAVTRSVDARLGLTFPREGTTTLTITARAGGQTTVRQVPVRVRPRKLAVLLLDRQPRYEVRYLREAFRRDRTVTIHAYLADGRWRRWSEDGPERLPLTGADLAAYDVVVVGDVGTDALRSSEAQALASAVRITGLGLVWLAGDGGALATWSGSPLGELVPAQLADPLTVGRGFSGPARTLARTATAERLGLLEPGDIPWERLPPLWGSAGIGAAKPGTDVLATDSDGKPVVLARSYGAGRSVLLAVDDTWRWRRGAGDRFLHRFHSQLIRWVAANHRADRKAWRLSASPRRVVPGEALTIAADPTREDLEHPAAAAVRLRRIAGPGATTAAELVIPLQADGDGLAARIAAPAIGTWAVEPARGLDSANAEDAELEVQPPLTEARDPRADHAALSRFAERTGARLFTDPDALLAALPTDLRQVEQEITTTSLWDRWWLIALVVSLLAIDWALRRWHRLP